MPSKIKFVAEIGLSVIDLDVMSRFYQEMLGFELLIARPNHVFLKIADLPSPLGEDHPQILGLFRRETAPDVHASTLDHLAFEIPVDAYEAELARFDAKGMVLRERVWPESLDWRGRSFFFRDPEGNVIELIAALDD